MIITLFIEDDVIFTDTEDKSTLVQITVLSGMKVAARVCLFLHEKGVLFFTSRLH